MAPGWLARHGSRTFSSEPDPDQAGVVARGLAKDPGSRVGPHGDMPFDWGSWADEEAGDPVAYRTFKAILAAGVDGEVDMGPAGSDPDPRPKVWPLCSSAQLAREYEADAGLRDVEERVASLITAESAKGFGSGSVPRL